MAIPEQMIDLGRERDLMGPDNPVVVMVSGGSDSTALAYAMAEARDRGEVGPVDFLHVNHGLRGAASDGDELFVTKLAEVLDIPLTCISVDVSGTCESEGGNIEATARSLRYQAANDALSALCQRCSVPVAQGRIAVAHTADDRVENFYMRSIVGTGPGGFRSMRYRNGLVVRPLLDFGREELRSYVEERARQGEAVVRTEAGELWCEDATNFHTDRFRAFVRHEIIPLAKERNPRLLETLVRTMNRIGDEDDMLEEATESLMKTHVHWLQPEQEGFVLTPTVATLPLPIQRRMAVRIIHHLLGQDVRIEASTVDAILEGFDGPVPRSGYVANVQGDIAISANREGVRIEPMVVFRTRRNRLKGEAHG